MTVAIEKDTHRPDIAVFTRNWPEYLKAAEKRSNEPTTFRSVKRWVKADDLLRKRKPLVLYIASIGGHGSVDFVADLYGTRLDPKGGEPETEDLLAHELPSTRATDEGLWRKDEHGKAAVGTLYVIKNCHRLTHPFPMTKLVKVSNLEHLSGDYGYSYSIVFALDQR